ncbi:MAG TPA: acyltransferase [Pseudonocardiaceae bacterium]|jgi:peptidoglycan/LPS O-acetylase OafA/YrhL|nr:acyltransferase [Pseudonocardiaceae bacterium]
MAADLENVPITKPDDARLSKLSSLTGLRFVAALLVFLYHVHWLGTFRNASVQHVYNVIVTNAGPVGVSFFFVLSGFVLTWSARKKDTAGRFWRRRLVKIFPNHVVVFAGAIILMIVTGVPIMMPQAIANLFLVHAWIPDMSYQLGQVNGVTWSLSVELVFYVLFPLLYLLIKKIRVDHLWGWAIGVGALITVLPALVMAFVPTQPVFAPYGMSWPWLWVLNFGPFARVLEFGFGMLLARIVQNKRWIGIPVLPAALLAVAGYVLSLFVPTQWTFVAPYAVPLGLLISAVAVGDIKGRRSWLSSRTMVWLGEISFAFFLLHFTLLFVLRGAVAGHLTTVGSAYQGLPWSTFGSILFILFALAVTIGLASLLYVLVERPAMRRWSRPRRVTPPVQPPSSAYPAESRAP